MPRHALLFTGLILTTLVTTPANAADKVRLVALPINSGEKLKPIADSIGEQMLTEMGKLERLEVMGASDVSSLLGLERQRAVMGCGDASASCLAEISAALGAPWMVTGTLAQSGKAMRLDLKLISAADGKVAFRGGRTFKDESEVFEVVSEIITALVKKIDLKPATTTVATTKPVEEKKPVVLTPVTPTEPPPPEVISAPGTPEPAPRIGPWVVVGAGAASAIAGAVLLGVGQSSFDTTTKNAASLGTKQLRADLESANTLRAGGAVALGVGVALAGAGVVWWLVAGKPTEGTSVGLSVSASSLTVHGCF